jgi:hypothetical protein
LNNKEWNEYKENLNYRRYITLADNPDFDWGQIRDVVSLVGWGKADYDLATNFQYDFGIPKFSTDSLKYIYQNAYGKFSWQAPVAYYNKYLAVFSLFLKYLSDKTDILVFMMFLPFLFLKKNWVLFTGLMFFLFWIMLILFILNTFFHVNIDKDRLLFVFSLPLYLTVLFVAYRSIMERTNSFDRYIGVYFCVILIIYTVTFNNKIVYRSWSNKAETVDKAQFIEDKSTGLYVSFCSLGDKSIFDVPSSFQKRYFLGGSAGTPYNKEKLLGFSGKKHEGLYGLKNQKIEWFYLMDQKAIWNRTINFYTANFRTVEIEEDTLYFGLKDSLFHQTISVSN